MDQTLKNQPTINEESSIKLWNHSKFKTKSTKKNKQINVRFKIEETKRRSRTDLGHEQWPWQCSHDGVIA